jgi:hypothetical protein
MRRALAAQGRRLQLRHVGYRTGRCCPSVPGRTMGAERVSIAASRQRARVDGARMTNYLAEGGEARRRLCRREIRGSLQGGHPALVTVMGSPGHRRHREIRLSVPDRSTRTMGASMAVSR